MHQSTKNSHRHEQAFAQAYSALNDQQKKAVDTIEGPVMVVAGPGTGKTQVLALRTANILLKTQMKPWNILCLTFSNSGAIAMRKRLRSIIGSDAYGVTVNTIHGFCNDIITANPQVFEDWSSLHQISDVEQYRIINSIIDQMMPDLAVVNVKNPYARTKEILERISQCKREGVHTEDQLLEAVNAYESMMSTKSREGTKQHKKNLLSARKFREFTQVFLQYQKLLKETSRYDFDDMVLNVINALQTEDWLLASLKERYQYILVDEFQDTNGAQFEVLKLLTEDPTGDNNPNFFIVGDDDQAIYRFQGANIQNILSFTHLYPHAPVIPLTMSYRCSQAILDAAESLIGHNSERLVGRIQDLEKHLQSPKKEHGEIPKMLLTASDSTENWMIADLVEDRIASGIDPKEIAILTQTNRELPPIYEVLQSRNIPVVLTGKLDLLEHPVVQQAVAILRSIGNPQNTSLLSTAIASACFQCHPADIAELHGLVRQSNRSLLEILLAIDSHNFSITLRNSDAVIHARDCILQLHNTLHQHTILDTLEALYKDCNLLQDSHNEQIDILDFAAAQELFHRVKQRAYEDTGYTFEMLLDDLEFYEDPNYGTIRLTYDLPHLVESGVQLMTAHKSKGLEFQTVILANFREKHWDQRRNMASLSIPEDILFGWEKEQKQYEQHQDERRVAFVAMTRAKSELLFTCPKEITSGSSQKAVSPSGFFAESGDLLEEERGVRDPEKMSTLLSVQHRYLDDEFKAYLRKKIEHFSLSATSLNTFLEDPQLFLEYDLMQKPKPRTATMAYGNAVHHTLAKWGESLKLGSALTEKELIDFFKKHMQKNEYLHEKERERLIHLGLQSLPSYIQKNLQSPFPLIYKVEYPIKATLGADSKLNIQNDIPIKGHIDRIDTLESQSSNALILDYKTGRPKSDKEVRDYGLHRQLVFYDVLIRFGHPVINPVEYALEFIGEGEHDPIRRSYVISEQDRKELIDVMDAVWQKILALDFTSL